MVLQGLHDGSRGGLGKYATNHEIKKQKSERNQTGVASYTNPTD